MQSIFRIQNRLKKRTFVFIYNYDKTYVITNGLGKETTRKTKT
jgi:hypothetical protein